MWGQGGAGGKGEISVTFFSAGVSRVPPICTSLLTGVVEVVVWLLSGTFKDEYDRADEG